MPKMHVADEVLSATPRRSVLVSAVLAWLESAAIALLLVQAGWALDALISEEAIEFPRLIALITTVAIAAAAGCAAQWVTQSASGNTEKDLRGLVVAGAFRLGPSRLKGKEGALLSMGTHAVDRAANYRAGFIGPMLGAMTSPILVLVIMGLTVDWVIAGWLALFLLIVPLAVGGFQSLVRPIGASYRATQATLTSAFLESIQAIDTLVYARAGGRAGNELAAKGEQHRRSLMKMLAGNQLLIFVVDAAFTLSIIVAAVWLAASRLGDGHISLGGAVAVVLLSVLVTGPVDVFGSFFYIGIGGRAAVRQLSAHVNATKGQHQAARTDLEPAHGAAIDIAHVTLGWPGGPPVLRDFSMRVEPGERVVIVGPSGVGKSTLSAMLQGYLVPEDGSVSVGGIDVVADPAGARENLSVVEQRAYIFLGSIADNLRLAAPEASDDQLWDALEIAGLADEIRKMPAGLDQQVGEHGALLSGGQSQRLAIARAMLRDTSILILDEPTSQVDLRAEEDILKSLDRLAQGRTVLMIAHRPGAILSADRIIEVKP